MAEENQNNPKAPEQETVDEKELEEKQKKGKQLAEQKKQELLNTINNLDESKQEDLKNQVEAAFAELEQNLENIETNPKLLKLQVEIWITKGRTEDKALTFIFNRLPKSSDLYKKLTQLLPGQETTGPRVIIPRFKEYLEGNLDQYLNEEEQRLSEKTGEIPEEYAGPDEEANDPYEEVEGDQDETLGTTDNEKEKTDIEKQQQYNEQQIKEFEEFLDNLLTEQIEPKKVALEELEKTGQVNESTLNKWLTPSEKNEFLNLKTLQERYTYLRNSIANTYLKIDPVENQLNEQGILTPKNLMDKKNYIGELLDKAGELSTTAGVQDNKDKKSAKGFENNVSSEGDILTLKEIALDELIKNGNLSGATFNKTLGKFGNTELNSENFKKASKEDKLNIFITSFKRSVNRLLDIISFIEKNKLTDGDIITKNANNLIEENQNLISRAEAEIKSIQEEDKEPQGEQVLFEEPQGEPIFVSDEEYVAPPEEEPEPEEPEPEPEEQEITREAVEKAKREAAIIDKTLNDLKEGKIELIKKFIKNDKDLNKKLKDIDLERDLVEELIKKLQKAGYFEKQYQLTTQKGAQEKIKVLLAKQEFQNALTQYLKAEGKNKKETKENQNKIIQEIARKTDLEEAVIKQILEAQLIILNQKAEAEHALNNKSSLLKKILKASFWGVAGAGLGAGIAAASFGSGGSLLLAGIGGLGGRNLVRYSLEQHKERKLKKEKNKLLKDLFSSDTFLEDFSCHLAQAKKDQFLKAEEITAKGKTLVTRENMTELMDKYRETILNYLKLKQDLTEDDPLPNDSVDLLNSALMLYKTNLDQQVAAEQFKTDRPKSFKKIREWSNKWIMGKGSSSEDRVYSSFFYGLAGATARSIPGVRQAFLAVAGFKAGSAAYELGHKMSLSKALEKGKTFDLEMFTVTSKDLNQVKEILEGNKYSNKQKKHLLQQMRTQLADPEFKKANPIDYYKVTEALRDYEGTEEYLKLMCINTEGTAEQKLLQALEQVGQETENLKETVTKRIKAEKYVNRVRTESAILGSLATTFLGEEIMDLLKEKPEAKPNLAENVPVSPKPEAPNPNEFINNTLKERAEELQKMGLDVTTDHSGKMHISGKYLDQMLRRVVLAEGADQYLGKEDNTLAITDKGNIENTLANLRELLQGKKVAGIDPKTLEGLKWDESKGELILDPSSYEKLHHFITGEKLEIDNNQYIFQHPVGTTENSLMDHAREITEGKTPTSEIPAYYGDETSVPVWDKIGEIAKGQDIDVKTLSPEHRELVEALVTNENERITEVLNNLSTNQNSDKIIEKQPANIGEMNISDVYQKLAVHILQGEKINLDTYTELRSLIAEKLNYQLDNPKVDKLTLLYIEEHPKYVSTLKEFVNGNKFYNIPSPESLNALMEVWEQHKDLPLKDLIEQGGLRSLIYPNESAASVVVDDKALSALWARMPGTSPETINRYSLTISQSGSEPDFKELQIFSRLPVADQTPQGLKLITDHLEAFNHIPANDQTIYLDLLKAKDGESLPHTILKELDVFRDNEQFFDDITVEKDGKNIHIIFDQKGANLTGDFRVTISESGKYTVERGNYAIGWSEPPIALTKENSKNLTSIAAYIKEHIND